MRATEHTHKSKQISRTWLDVLCLAPSQTVSIPRTTLHCNPRWTSSASASLCCSLQGRRWLTKATRGIVFVLLVTTAERPITSSSPRTFILWMNVGGGGRRGRRRWLAATLLSVCPRAAVATDVAYRHRYDCVWMTTGLCKATSGI